MEIIAPQKTLFAALERVAPFADQRSAMPALEHVQITATEPPAIGNAKITLLASNLYVSMKTTFEARVERPGTVSVHAKDLLSRVKSMPVGDVHLDTKGNDVRLKALGSARRFQLTAGDPATLPVFGAPSPSAHVVTLPTAVLAQRIAEVLDSILADDTRPHMSAALMLWTGKTFSMVSTDGHRLTMSSATLDEVHDLEALLPRDAVLKLRAVLDPKVEKVTITIDGPSATFDLGAGGRVHAKLAEGTFPKHESVIPADVSRIARVDRLKLLGLASAVGIAADPKNNRVSFRFRPGMLQATTESAEHGSAFDEIEIDCAHELETGLNYKYITTALGALNTEEVLIAMPTNDLEPIRIDPAPREGLESIFVIMPMR